MSNKNYLYKKSSGEWIYGTNKESICPAGTFRLDVGDTGLIRLRHIYNRDNTFHPAGCNFTDFLKENGDEYASLNEFIAATADFFSGKITITVAGSDIQIGTVELKDADSDIRAKIAAGSSMEISDKALAVADANAKNTLSAILSKIIEAPATEAKQDTIIANIAALKAEQFPGAIHILTGTDPAGAGTYLGFYALEADTVIASISGVDTDLVKGDNDFSEITFQPGIYIRVPGGFTDMALTSGAMALAIDNS